jgi:hypothetical protein
MWPHVKKAFKKTSKKRGATRSFPVCLSFVCSHSEGDSIFKVATQKQHHHVHGSWSWSRSRSTEAACCRRRRRSSSRKEQQQEQEQQQHLG